MMPGVGLFLPEILHRSDTHNLTQIANEERIPGQAFRSEPRTSQDTSMSTSRRSIDQKSSFSEEIVEASGLTAAVFSYADFVFASSKRPAEAELFASLVRRTRQDLTEASRLYLSPTVSKFLEAWPDRKSWIDKVLSDIRAVLIDIGTHIESVRTTRDDDEAAKRKRKFEYTLSHQKRLAQKQQTLVNIHQVLLGAIQVMQTVEQCVGLGGVAQDSIFEAPVRPWLRSESEIIRAPYSQRSSSRNLSALSFAASEVTDKYEMRHREEPLAELPGSTPDDLLNANGREPPSCTSTQRPHSYNSTRADFPTGTHMLYRRMGPSSPKETKTVQLSMSHKLFPESEGAQTRASNEQADRKSAHGSSSLNAVVDRIIERTQSIASTTASIRMPVLVKRYRPRPVYVQRPHLKHHSLPSKLPPYKIQPSLEDDLRDWMIQTAASEYPSDTELTCSPTVSSTTGSIASRHEMMKIMASIPNVEEDDQEANATSPVTKTSSVYQDGASDYPLPPTSPSSPPMTSDSGHAQESTELLSSFPMPPSRSEGLPVAADPARPEQEIQSSPFSRKEPIPTPPKSYSPIATPETIQTHGGDPSPSYPQDDLALAANLPLPLSQPNSPSMPSETLHQPQRTVRSRHSSSVQRKPLPPAIRDTLLTRPSPETSTKPHHCVQLTEGGTTPQSPSDVQGVSERYEPPKQPERPPPPPPPARASSSAPSVIGSEMLSKTSGDHTTVDEVPVRSRPPPPVPFFDAPSQANLAPEVRSTPPKVPVTPVLGPYTNSDAPKSRTAEAKRRAAHARRMKLAFGE